MYHSQKQIDDVLGRLLPCDSKREYELTLAKLATEYEWGEPDARGRRDGGPAAWLLWALATLVQKYTSCMPTRNGPLTHVEKEMIKWATTTRSERATRPDAEYLSLLLGRSLEEVTAAMERYGPSMGRKGFGLTG